MTSIPWLLPGTVAALMVAVLLSARVAELLRTTRRSATLLMTTAGLVAAATLTPTRLRLDYDYQGSGVCDLSRLGPSRIDEWLLLGDPALNVLLFAPLGAAIAFLPRTRRTAAVAVAAAASPFVIELVQLAVKSLGRGCQSGDVVDNLTGLVIGFLGGTAVLTAFRLRPGT